MNIEDSAQEALDRGDYTQAKTLAEQAISLGHKTEAMYGIISECEFNQGDALVGLRIAEELARNTNSYQAIERLSFYIALLLSGAQRTVDSKPLFLKINQTSLDSLLEIILEGFRNSVHLAPISTLLMILMNLGTIGYRIDGIKSQKFGKFARSIVRALPLGAKKLPEYFLLEQSLATVSEKYKRVRTTQGKSFSPQLRPAANFLAAAGYTEEAEDLMARISIPLRPGTNPKEISEITGISDSTQEAYDCPEIERNSRTLARLIGETSQLGQVLDIGCGTGLMAKQIRNRSSSIHGIDIDEKRIAAAREKGIYDHLETVDVLKWDSYDKFDTIVSCMTTCYIRDFGSFIFLLSSQLKFGGRAYFDLLICGGDCEERVLDDHFLRTRFYAKRLIEDAGMQIIQENIGPNQLAIGSYIEIAHTET